MSNSKPLKGLLGAVEAEKFLFKNTSSYLKNLFKQVVADEQLESVVNEKLDFKSTVDNLLEESSYVLSQANQFLKNDPESTDEVIRKQGNKIKDQLISVRRKITSFSEEIEVVISNHPYLMKPLPVGEYDKRKERIVSLSCKSYGVKETIKDMETLPDEAKTIISESVQSELSLLEDKVLELKALVRKAEDLEESNLVEALRLLCVEGQALKEEVMLLDKNFRAAVQSAQFDLMKSLRSSFLEDYYDVIRLFPNGSDEVVIAENARREVEEDTYEGYYGDEALSVIQTFENIYLGKRMLASIER